jgi:glucan phosphoethanolaminetransferase (alkaline phosphatase superfamily)
MWQRIQTVFLVIAILCLLGSVFFPIWAVSEGDKSQQLFALHYMTRAGETVTNLYIPYALTGVLFIAAITIMVLEITRYKNRVLQIKLGTLNSLLLVGGYGAAVYFGSAMLKNYGGHYGLGMYLPAAAVFLNWLSMRFIRRDERIVRDSDRLR